MDFSFLAVCSLLPFCGEMRLNAVLIFFFFNKVGMYFFLLFI